MPLFSIISFVIIISALILLHEWGHFIAAKKSGMRVDEFGIGFPPRLGGIRRGETLYSVNLLPIGGFVRILGEGGEEATNPRSFASRSAGRRAFVLGAGVLVNVLIAYAIFTAVQVVGVPTLIDDSTPLDGTRDVGVQVVSVDPASPAAEAGLQIGDRIAALGVGEDVWNVDLVAQVQEITSEYGGQDIVVSIERGSERFDISVYARTEFPGSEGPLGISIARTGIVSHPWYEAPWRGVHITVAATTATFAAFGDALQSGIRSRSVPETISGPVGIVALAGQLRTLGTTYFLQLIAIISLNLAILNILPFPALDGGRIVFVVIEKIKGSPVNQRVEGMIHASGFALLMLLVAVITYHDIKGLL
jgi:regulator of sigma E protease